jgi:hypothetical protein
MQKSGLKVQHVTSALNGKVTPTVTLEEVVITDAIQVPKKEMTAMTNPIATTPVSDGQDVLAQEIQKHVLTGNNQLKLEASPVVSDIVEHTVVNTCAASVQYPLFLTTNFYSL